ncbi:MAG: histidine phosphatase family protein [Gammaproteobacteria bacterium]
MAYFLTLVRHAKSNWNNDDLQDFDRPLNDRGLRVAPEMGQRLARKSYNVEAIISSPALRAMTTAQIIAEEIGFKVDQISLNEDIYEANLDVLVNIVNQFSESFNSVMLVGHNPGFTMLTNYLSNAKIDNMPTCSIAQIKFTSNAWSTISERSGELVGFDYPKKY